MVPNVLKNLFSSGPSEHMSDLRNGVETTAMPPIAQMPSALYSVHEEKSTGNNEQGTSDDVAGSSHEPTPPAPPPPLPPLPGSKQHGSSGSESSVAGIRPQHHHLYHQHHHQQQHGEHYVRPCRSRPTSIQEPLSPSRLAASMYHESPCPRRSQMDLAFVSQNPAASHFKTSSEFGSRVPTPSHSDYSIPSQRPPLYKSMSSNNIPPPPTLALSSPTYSGRGSSSHRPWRYPSSSMVRPVHGLPYSPSQLSLTIRNGGGCGCQCQCDRARKPSGEGSSIDEEGGVTSEGLTWRRLHMSRAKLKATATTSELLSGFAMVAMVELQINEPTNVPEWLFVMFSVCTTVLVAVHIFALMISTYLLPNIDAISKLQVHELVSESPHERMRGFIELAWAFSTVLGLFLFLVEIAILCWVKFWDYSFTAAWAATIIVIPVLIVFVAFAVHFYHSLVKYKCDSTVDDLQQLEDMKKHLDSVGTGNPV